MNLPAAGLLAVLVLFFAYLFGQAKLDEARADALLDTDDDVMDLADSTVCLCDDCLAWAFRSAPGGGA